MFTGREIADLFVEMGVTHVVWLPDSTIGLWESELDRHSGLRLVRVCREGEAWPLAAGLLVGGRWPIVLIQTTGLFESGDALRNVWFDLKIPVFAMIGARSWLKTSTSDSARRYTEPVMQAWGVDYLVISQPDQKPRLADHYRRCRRDQASGAVLLAE